MNELSRREREKQFRRHEIIEAAMRVLAKKGFYGATMDDIAAEAEFSKGALYLYFKNKEEIFLGIVEMALEQERDFLTEVLEEKGSNIDKLNKIMRGYFDYAEKNRNLIRILHSESQKLYASSKERIKNVLISNRKIATESIANILRKAIKANEIREIDPELSALIYQGIMNSVIFDWFQGERKEGSLIEKTDSVLDLFLRGIIK